MKKNVWRLIIEGKNNAFKNMAIDKAILMSYEDVCVPTLRFYRWEVATLSFGYFQELPENVIKVCKEKNIPIVRRPTGGKAVLHDDEITYSIVAPYYLFSNERNILSVYNSISKAFIKAFKDMNLEVELAQSKISNNSSQFCFSEQSYYEITINSKKIIGNAQRYNKDILLQHGSLPIGRNLLLINKLFGKEQEEKWTCIEECLGYHPDVEYIYDKIINAFKDIFKVEFSNIPYFPIELEKANLYEINLYNSYCKM